MYTLFDTHCDTISALFKNGGNLFENNCHISIKKLSVFKAPVQVFAVWLDKSNAGNYCCAAKNVINFYYNQLEKYRLYISHANSAADIIKNKNENKISGILALEGGEPLEGSLEKLREFYNLGVRILTFTWNNKNELASGINDEKDGGLSDFGAQVTALANKLGIIIDVSHLSPQSFKDVTQITKCAVIASHSNAFSICPNKRNLTNSQILKIAELGGVIGLNLYPPFLTEKAKAAVSDIANHARHIVKLAGTDCLGFGCDFDGIEKTPEGVKGADDLLKVIPVFESLFGKEAARKILHENFMRLFGEICRITK
ncbi:MAG: dipeptidase [Clostridiales bacterium]|jgi:membrane dipeptidase|nr:dipeptidase [Clostridiales bacterium]